MMQTLRYIHTRTRGSALVAALWVIVALVAIVLILSRWMTVEAIAAKQQVCDAKCATAEMGAEQYVLAGVNAEMIQTGYIDALNCEQREIGDCYFWILTPNLDGSLDSERTSNQQFGFTDEASKLDLNSVTYEQLMGGLASGSGGALPTSIMSDEFATAILAWRAPEGDPNADTTGNGPDDNYYTSLDPPYHQKEAPFESIEELRLLKGYDPLMMYSIDSNHNDSIEDAEFNNGNNTGMNFDTTMRGLSSYVTVYGVRATNPPAATQPATTGTTGTTGTTTATTQPSTTQPADINAFASAQTTTPGGGDAGRGGTTTAQSNSALQTLLQQLAQDGDITTAQSTQLMTQTVTAHAQGAFSSVWDWANKLNMDSTTFGAIYPYITCIQPATAATTTNTETGETVTPAPVAKVNINKATKVVLMALGFEDSDADAIRSYIEDQQSSNTDQFQDISDIAWLLDVVNDRTTLTLVGPYITGKSTVWSADIVVATKDGRAFRRVKIVVDASQGNPAIVYRRDLTALGWPLDPQIRKDLIDSHGDGLPSVGGSGSSHGSGLSLGR